MFLQVTFANKKVKDGKYDSQSNSYDPTHYNNGRVLNQVWELITAEFHPKQNLCACNRKNQPTKSSNFENFSNHFKTIKATFSYGFVIHS